MAASFHDEPPAQLGRSSSMEGLPRSDSQRRSIKPITGSVKRGQRSSASGGSEIFVCFAPRTSLHLNHLPRPVLSPVREQKTHPPCREKSLFSKATVRKTGHEEGHEEPTSPKVTCIGQVRVKNKKNKEAKLQRAGQEGRHKDSACSSFGKDFSCFGLPCDSYGGLPSFHRGDKKSTGGAVFAKSLVLIQKEANEAQVKLHSPVPQVLESPQFQSATTDSTIQDTERKNKEPLLETEMMEENTIDAAPAPLSSTSCQARPEVVSTVYTALTRCNSAPLGCKSKEGEEDTWFEPIGDEDPSKSAPNSLTSFLTRCKSVSQHSTHPNDGNVPGLPADETKNYKVTADNGKLQCHLVAEDSASKPSVNVEDAHRAQAMLEMVHAAGASNTESLKVSLDFVRETWLCEQHTALTRPSKSEMRSLVNNKQRAEWLDAELETSLWRSCKAPASIYHQVAQYASQKDISANAAVDAEVEATSWTSSIQYGSGLHGEDSIMQLVDENLDDDANEMTSRVSFLGRSSSLGSYGAKQLERGGTLCRSCSMGSQCRKILSSASEVEEGGETNTIENKLEGQERHLLLSVMEDKENWLCEMKKATIEANPACVHPLPKLTEEALKPPSRESSLCGRKCEVVNPRAEPVTHVHTNDEQNLNPVDMNPAPDVFPVTVDEDLVPTSSPPPAPQALLQLLGAFRIALDAPDSVLSSMEQKAADTACMLQAVSHLHGVGTSARLPKASSGKEQMPLSSAAFPPLPRCKSEPVRLTSC